MPDPRPAGLAPLSLVVVMCNVVLLACVSCPSPKKATPFPSHSHTAAARDVQPTSHHGHNGGSKMLGASAGYPSIASQHLSSSYLSASCPSAPSTPEPSTQYVAPCMHQIHARAEHAIGGSVHASDRRQLRACIRSTTAPLGAPSAPNPAPTSPPWQTHAGAPPPQAPGARG